MSVESLDAAAGAPGRAARCGCPGSKSISNRTLLLAALARRRHRSCTALLDSDDTRVMREALRALGVRVEELDGAGASCASRASGARAASR